MIRTNLSISSPFAIYFVFLAVWLCYFSVYFLVTVHNTSYPIHSHKSNFLSYDYDYQSQDKNTQHTKETNQVESTQKSSTNSPLKTYAEIETKETKAPRLRGGNINQNYVEVKMRQHSFNEHIHVENPSISYDQETYNVESDSVTETNQVEEIILNGESKSLDYEQLSKDFSPSSGPSFVPASVARSPMEEVLSCVKGDYHCIDFPETHTSWPEVPTDTYESIIGHSQFYTNPNTTTVKVSDHKCKLGAVIKVEIQAKNGNNVNKNYGGDYFLVRLASTSEKYRKMRITSEIKGTYVKASMHDHRDGTYTAKLPCVIQGNFTIQTFLIRNSETIEASKRIMAGFHPKGNFYFQTLKDNSTVSCGPLIAKDLIGSNKEVCEINGTPGQEWYCEKLDNKPCEMFKWFGFKGKNWIAGQVVSDFELDLIFEDLIDEQPLEITPSDTIQNPLSKFPMFKGYWNDKTWKSSLRPYHGEIDNGVMGLYRIFENKRVVTLGDHYRLSFFKSSA